MSLSQPGLGNRAAGSAAETERWTVTWTASTGGCPGAAAGPEATIRQTMRVSAGGRAIRVRFANPHLYTPLQLSGATVAVAGAQPASLAGKAFPVLVGGEARIEVHPGCVVTSDPIPLELHDLATVAVSIFCSGQVEISGHDWANRLAWTTSPAIGDRTSDASGAGFRPLGTSWVWVDAIEVLDADTAGVVAVLGDSITDGAGSDFGTDTRWTDFLAGRFASLLPGDPRRRAVANAGIGGNTLRGQGTPLTGVNAWSRLERDVLSLSGITEVIVFTGTNDLSDGTRHELVIGGLGSVADRIHAAGYRAFVATMIPRWGGYLWDEGQERHRRLTNDWIRGQSVFDAVLDLEPVVDDPEFPGQIRTCFDADKTHPNSAGYRALAESVDLDLFSPAAVGVDAPLLDPCNPMGIQPVHLTQSVS